MGTESPYDRALAGCLCPNRRREPVLPMEPILATHRLCWRFYRSVRIGQSIAMRISSPPPALWRTSCCRHGKLGLALAGHRLAQLRQAGPLWVSQRTTTYLAFSALAIPLKFPSRNRVCRLNKKFRGCHSPIYSDGKTTPGLQCLRGLFDFVLVLMREQ